MTIEELKKPIERLQGTEASDALRRLLWAKRAEWMPTLIGDPRTTDARSRDYAAGAVQFAEELYDLLRGMLDWRAESVPKPPPSDPVSGP